VIPDDYFNEVFYGIAKALYFERGRGAYFRSTMVGLEYLQPDAIVAESPDALIQACMAALQKNGIIRQGSFERDESGNLVTLQFTGSLHFAADQRLQADGVPPYICPPANMILNCLRTRFDLAVEIATIRLDIEREQHIVEVIIFKPSVPKKGGM
jgi:hypothetical protein